MRNRGFHATRHRLDPFQDVERHHGALWLLKPFIVVVVVAIVVYALGWWSPGNPKMRHDGVLEFSTPSMGLYRCTTAGTHYDGWPTGQPCVVKVAR